MKYRPRKTSGIERLDWGDEKKVTIKKLIYVAATKRYERVKEVFNIGGGIFYAMTEHYNFVNLSKKIFAPLGI